MTVEDGLATTVDGVVTLDARPAIPGPSGGTGGSARGGGLLIDGGRVTLSGCVLNVTALLVAMVPREVACTSRNLSRPTLPATVPAGPMGATAATPPAALSSCSPAH